MKSDSNKSTVLVSLGWSLVAAAILGALFIAEAAFPRIAALSWSPLLKDGLWAGYTLAAIIVGVTALLRVKHDWMRIILYGAAVVCMVFLAWRKMGSPAIGVDDANIFMVYARNLQQGNGFVYNAGGEHVEGFSSLLWLLVMAVAFMFSATPEPILFVINVALLLTSLYLVLRFLADCGETPEEKRLLPAALIFFLCANPEFLTWTTFTLMDTGLWSVLLVACTMTILRTHSTDKTPQPWIFGALLAALAVTRPESLFWGLVFVLLFGWRIYSLSDLRTAVLHALPPLAIFLGTVALLTIFRLAYFGYPFPNTYYAKVSTSIFYNAYQGFYYYFVEFAQSKALFAAGILATIWILIAGATGYLRARFRRDGVKDSPKTPDSLLLSTVCFTGLLLPVVYGGDHFLSFRQYQPIVPLLLSLMLIAGLPLLRRMQFQLGGYGRAGVLLLAAPLLLFSFTDTVTWGNVDQPGKSIHVEFDLAVRGRDTGVTLREIFAGYGRFPSVGVITAGGVKMTYPGEVIDLMGLNNVLMGHNKGPREGMKNHSAFDADTFFLLRPEIVLTGCSAEKPDSYLHDIQLDPRFAEAYECVTLAKKGTGWTMAAAISHALLDELAGQGAEEDIEIGSSF